jgi:hypothetical protein
MFVNETLPEHLGAIREILSEDLARISGGKEKYIVTRSGCCDIVVGLESDSLGMSIVVDVHRAADCH